MENKLMTFWRWFLNGSDDMVMSKEWLANRDRIRQYMGYTMRQRHQGRVVSDTAEMRRRAFWTRQEAKRKPHLMLWKAGQR